MKHRWTTLLWELWAAQALCAVAALPPGSAFHTCPALALPGLALAAAVPTAWAAWALLAEPPDGLPPEGPVLVLGIGNRRVTADALGPRTAQKILVTMGPQHTLPVKGIRPVAAIAPGVSASTGLTLRQLAGAMVEAVRPAALICVDSLCSAEGARLGRSVQFSDTGLYPAQADHAKHLDAAALGVPVIAAGIPTLMDSDEGADLVVTPRALDSVIAHGSALLAGAINRALQPRLSVAQLFWLAG